MAAAVIANSGANGFGYFVNLRQQFLDGKLLKIGISFEGFVEIGDVCGVVLVVMNLHRFCIDVRFECVECVRQRWQCKSHLGSSSLSSLGHYVPPDYSVPAP